ncbi:MAG TPA: TetR/AcrR family transcriptional regulator [Kofleriaceae bacterium]|jgi:AcrR family transcriptional regulator|nr:TetR/AcrR family transcriptional regulator [Kofleriaceae bacterium]
MAGKGEGKGEATRRAILDGAVALASRHGLEGCTIGRLAEETGLSKSGLFAHFGSKENLDVEVVRAARGHFVAEVIAPALKAARGEPRLRALLDRWLTWIQHPGGCIFVALSAELDDQPGSARDALEEAMRDWLDVLASAAGIAVDEGHFRKGTDTRQFAFELYGVMLASHHLIRFHHDPKGLIRTRKAFERLIESCR